MFQNFNLLIMGSTIHHVQTLSLIISSVAQDQLVKSKLILKWHYLVKLSVLRRKCLIK